MYIVAASKASALVGMSRRALSDHEADSSCLESDRSWGEGFASLDIRTHHSVPLCALRASIDEARRRTSR
jgi:hypothetical protein